MRNIIKALFLIGFLVGGMQSSHAQERDVSPGKALALSLLLPGLGHRYIQGGDWGGSATAFALIDVGIWAGLAGSEFRRDHYVDSYTTLASMSAGADLDGKGRDFFLNLASYVSSDDYLAARLRSRSWSDIDDVVDPDFQWRWESEEDFQRFRALREDAESLQRRRTFLIATLVANRLISGFAALRGARRVDATDANVSLSMPPAGSVAPMMNLRLRW